MQQPVTMDGWIPDENRRKQQYRTILSSGDLAAQLMMLKMLRIYCARQQEIGKKLHICDDNFMRDVQKIIAGEVAVVLEVSMAEALASL